MPDFATSILTDMATTTTGFLQAFISGYWPWILSVIVILSLGRLLFRLGRGGGR